MKKLMMLCAVATFVCACTDDSSEETGFSASALKVTAVTEGSGTRVMSEDGLKFQFRIGDKIGLYFFSDTEGENPLSEGRNICYEVVSIDGDGTATFEPADALTADISTAKQVYAYYPYDAATVLSGGAISCTVPQTQTQLQNDDFTHLYDEYVMVTKLTDIVDGAGNPSVDLLFSGAFSLARFRVTNNTSDILSLESFKLAVSSDPLHGDFKIYVSTDPAFSGISAVNDSNRYTDGLMVGKDPNYSFITYDVIVSLSTPLNLAVGEQAVLYAIVYANNRSTGKNEVYPFYYRRYTITTASGSYYKEIGRDNAHYFFQFPRNKRTTFNVSITDADKVAE